MDSLIAAAARALNAGDAIGALQHVGIRDDPPALALRGIAMAQLGLLPRARELLRLAARGFGPREPRLRARCVVAEAEVALATRDLSVPQTPLIAAARTLIQLGDAHNAQVARVILARRALLLGQLEAATRHLDDLRGSRLAPSLAAIVALVRAELALRSLRIDAARAALAGAKTASIQAGIPALIAEVTAVHEHLERPAARCTRRGTVELLRLGDVATLLHGDELIVDACRHGVRHAERWVSLVRRPVLLSLARALAAAAPGDIERNRLIARVFRIRRPDETHRARLRVELGRLRRALAGMARIEATTRGYALRTPAGRAIVLLEPPIDGASASLQALLADGAAWSTSALALAHGTSQRTVQRLLGELEAQGRVRSIQRARARRWLATPLVEFTTILLLPGTLPVA